jgi:biotin synthase-like enzyme
MANYICKHCKFRSSSERIPKDCPYCGRSTLEKEKSAEELLTEIDDILSE